jgi:hypothetical protein
MKLFSWRSRAAGFANAIRRNTSNGSIVCDQAQALSGISWRKARSLLRTDLPRLVREHVISMDQLTVMFINTNAASGYPHAGIEGR